MYTDAQIEQIKRAAESDFLGLVASTGVSVKPAGSGAFRCPCPIHNGRHLNFTWNPSTGKWHCNSKCVVKYGDVFDFVQQMGWAQDYQGAADYLASRAHFDTTYVRPDMDADELVPLDPEELRFCRGYHPYWTRVSKDTRLHLEGGYCNTTWHPLYGRVTFPVRDRDGTLVGVIGRTTADVVPDILRKNLRPDRQTRFTERWEHRYWNFGASRVNENGKPCGGFAKGLLLYNYDKAQEPSLPLLIVEGPFDVAMSIEHGWRQVVGLLGKVITGRQREMVVSSQRPVIYGLDTETFDDGTYGLFRASLKGSGIRLHTLRLCAEDVGASTHEQFWGAFRRSLQIWENL